jgi:hypothetical protein
MGDQRGNPATHWSLDDHVGELRPGDFGAIGPQADEPTTMEGARAVEERRLRVQLIAAVVPGRPQPLHLLLREGQKLALIPQDQAAGIRADQQRKGVVRQEMARIVDVPADHRCEVSNLGGIPALDIGNVHGRIIPPLHSVRAPVTAAVATGHGEITVRWRTPARPAKTAFNVW